MFSKQQFDERGNAPLKAALKQVFQSHLKLAHRNGRRTDAAETLTRRKWGLTQNS
jgi:hypothetical protein